MGRERKEIVHLGRSKTYKILGYFTFVHFAGGRGNKSHRNMDMSKNVKNGQGQLFGDMSYDIDFLGGEFTTHPSLNGF